MTSESDKGPRSEESEAAASRREARNRPSALGDEDDSFADEAAAEEAQQSGPIPELVRKALAVGLAGFFSTEHTIRKALGDTLPQEWVDFVSDQSERTRGDLTEAIASEVGRTLKTIDLTRVADQLLTGRTLEVSARIRLLPLEDEDDPSHDHSHNNGEAEGSDT